MLETTCAYIVSESRENGKFLFEICDEMGVGTSRQFASIAAAEKQTKISPICFFLFPASENDKFIADHVREIRTSSERNICFAPVILLTPDAQRSKITLGLSLGFDEILAPPWTTPLLRARFLRQLTNSFDYFSTETYFGPDRRRLESQQLDYYTKERRDHTYNFRRYSIRRHTVNGVEILTDERFEVRNGVKRYPAT